MNTKSRFITIGINVPAYATIEVPDHIGDDKEALAQYAREQFEEWWNDADNFTLETEWSEADKSSERIVNINGDIEIIELHSND